MLLFPFSARSPSRLRRTQEGMTQNISRQPKGIPAGGQFAAAAHAESPVTLSTSPMPANPFLDADGTDWEMGGDDPHTDTYTSHVGGIEARVTPTSVRRAPGWRSSTTAARSP